jgi:hypothetical protein
MSNKARVWQSTTGVAALARHLDTAPVLAVTLDAFHPAASWDPQAHALSGGT